MRGLAIAAACLLLSATGRAEEELEWAHEGYAELLDAAVEAKKDNRRLLIGLCGSPT